MDTRPHLSTLPARHAYNGSHNGNAGGILRLELLLVFQGKTLLLTTTFTMLRNKLTMSQIVRILVTGGKSEKKKEE